MGQVAEKLNTRRVAFQMAQILEAWVPGYESEIKYAGTARIEYDEAGFEQGVWIDSLSILQEGGTWKSVQIPLRITGDWGRLLRKCQEAAQRAAYEEDQMDVWKVTTYERIPERPDISELV